jgi:uncharacterized membrane protein YqjE
LFLFLKLIKCIWVVQMSRDDNYPFFPLLRTSTRQQVLRPDTHLKTAVVLQLPRTAQG